MNIDYTALGAWIAVVGLIIAIVALIAESRRSRFSLSVDLILKLDERFNGELISKARKAAAKSISDKTYDEVDDVLDFFEMIGMLTRHRALDEKMVWSMFSYWIYHYWYSTKEYVDETRKKTPTIWSYLAYLHKRMLAVDRRESGNADYEQAPTEEELKEFLEYEIS